MNKQFIKTAEKITVPNYPYGFREKTTLFNYVEFDVKKGYRLCTQTINPKTGNLNAPKKSTYSPLIVRYYEDNGHINYHCFDFNGDEEINKGCKFVDANFALFTVNEIQYLYNFVFSMAIVDLKATIIYGGAKMEDIKPLYTQLFDNAKIGIKAPQLNYFNLMLLDSTAIDATKPKDYNPFKVTSYGV